MSAAATTWLATGSALPSPLLGVLDAPVAADATPIQFIVAPGASAAVVANELERTGLIRSGLRFRQLALTSGVDGRLEAGRYELRRDMSVQEILDSLVSGRGRRANLVTIPEGLRAEQVALLLQAQGVVDAPIFLDLVARGAPDLELPAGAPSFEGYLFPDSYEFSPGASASTVLRAFWENFQRRTRDVTGRLAQQPVLSLSDVVVLASVVEREAVVPGEQGRIASVFRNRLQLGLPLEADPTVQYALLPFPSAQPAGGFWKRVLDGADLSVASPYNTYRNPGLPLGPICNPGLGAIAAVVSPEPGPWLYFVARGDGTHLFASTLNEHLENLVVVGREE